MKLFFPVALFLLIAFTSCSYVSGKRVKGNGTVKTQSISEHGFQHINVSSAINVYVKQDSIESVTVQTDENLLEYVEVYLSKTTLIIRQKKGYNLKPTNKISVYVSGPSFRHFEASGACSIYSENKLIGSDEVYIDLSGASNVNMEFNARKINLDLSGASSVRLKGETKDLSIEGSGASEIKCFDLLTENTVVALFGAGDAEVFASVKLDVKVSGAANIKYKGNPTVSQKVSGAGSVKKAE